MKRTLHTTSGFTYITVIVMMVIMGIMLGAAGQVSKTVLQRDREEELIFRGCMIKHAIERWYSTNTATHPSSFPLKKLEDLLKDPSSTTRIRFLSRLYTDPMTGKEWKVIQDTTGGIIGVSSSSDEKPFKIGGFTDELKDLEGKQKYSEWQFTYQKPTTTTPTTTPTTTTPSPTTSK